MDQVPKTPEYRYTICSTESNSYSYGNCDICGEHCSEVFLQDEECRYEKDEGQFGWTKYGCKSHFGHEACLLSMRR